MRTAVLSLATSDGVYPRGLERLHRSLIATGYAGQVRLWHPGEWPPGCPSHQDVPFAFKPFAFAEARRCDVDLALWLDASCLVLRPLDDWFAHIARTGHLLFRNGRHRVGEWAGDAALARLGLSRDEAMRIDEIDAAIVGLDLRHPVAGAFLDRWLAEAAYGVAFRGSDRAPGTPLDALDVKWNHRRRVSSDLRVRGHRHDQTVAGVLADRLGMPLVAPGADYVVAGRAAPTPETIAVHDRDLAIGGAPRRLARLRRHPWLAPAMRRLRRWWLVLRSRGSSAGARDRRGLS